MARRNPRVEQQRADSKADAEQGRTYHGPPLGHPSARAHEAASCAVEHQGYSDERNQQEGHLYGGYHCQDVISASPAVRDDVSEVSCRLDTRAVHPREVHQDEHELAAEDR